MTEYKRVPGEDSQSSDNDSVTIERLLWTEYFRFDHRRTFGVRTVILILLVQIITYSAIILLLAWILKNQESYHSSDGNDMEKRPSMRRAQASHLAEVQRLNLSRLIVSSIFSHSDGPRQNVRTCNSAMKV
jgi:hypothetical protein